MNEAYCNDVTNGMPNIFASQPFFLSVSICFMIIIEMLSSMHEHDKPFAHNFLLYHVTQKTYGFAVHFNPFDLLNGFVAVVPLIFSLCPTIS